MTKIIKSIMGKDVKIGLSFDNRDVVLETTGVGDRCVNKKLFLDTLVSEGILGENATVITDLPEARLASFKQIDASGYYRSLTTPPEEVLENAKALLAIHAFLVKHNAEQEEAKKAEAEAAKAKEAAHAKRRDEVTQELTGDPSARYSDRFAIVKKAIDRIVDLEEAAKVS